MTLAIENFSSGTAQFNTFGGPGSISSTQAGTQSTGGTDRLVVWVFCTGRSQTPGVTTISHVNTLTASGLTPVHIISEEWHPTVPGNDPSFPEGNMAFDVWIAPASSQLTSLAWSTTTSDTYVNNQICLHFAISGLPDINDVDQITPVIAYDFSGSNSHPEIPGVATDQEAAVLAFFACRNSGFTYNAESGYTIVQADAGGHSSSNWKFALDRLVESSAIAKTIGDASGSTSYWWGIAFAFGSPDPSSGTDGNASGVTITATTSIIGGTAYEIVDANASGVTLTATASLPSTGVAGDHTEMDGTEIYEITFNTIPSGQYQEADYYSIYSVGSRYQNGLITFSSYGLGVNSGAIPGGAFDNSYGLAAGSGWNPTSSGTAAGLGMIFQTGTLLAGVRFLGASELAERTNSWQLVAGMSAGSVWPESYALEFDYFKPSQNQEIVVGQEATELEMTPRIPIEWTYYEFRVFPSSQVLAGERFAEEIEFKVFHSILDGGDRRSTNGRPEKQVTLTLSSDWGVDISAGRVHPNDAWLDGSTRRGNAGGQPSVNSSHIGANNGSGGLAGNQTTVGAYIQFEFPRPVIQQHIVLQVNNPEVYDSGDEPTVYGKWHWEYSKNGGATWTPIGIQWWFVEDTGNYLLAPHTGEAFGLAGDIDLGTGATLWRMVLDEGPAFGGTNPASEILFNVIDSEELTTQLTISFTDDADGAPAVPTIGGPGTPYVVAFSDGSSDVLTLSLENVPNPVLVIAFTDEGVFDTWSDLYPSVTIQTVVVATGKAT